MLSSIFSGVARCYYFLARIAPGPRLISFIRRRDGMKWGVPAMLAAVPYFLVANHFKGLIENGGDAWLAIPLLWCLAMGIAFLVMGSVSLLMLAKARIIEAAAVRKLRRQLDAEHLSERDPAEVA